MSKIKFETYKDDEVTKELLDSVTVWDSIKVNDWGKWHKVKCVIDNYFVMTCNMFGKEYYSVCEKLPWGGTRYNSWTGGKFHVGADFWMFGCYIWNQYGCDKYDFDNIEATTAYLKSFEKDYEGEYKSELSRRAIPINVIHVKRG